MKDSYIINHTSFCSNFGCNYYLCIRITGKSDFLFPFQLRDGFLSSFQIGVKVHKINQRICNICRCVIFSFTMWVMQSLCCFFLTVTILKYWHTRFRGTWIRRNYIFDGISGVVKDHVIPSFENLTVISTVMNSVPQVESKYRRYSWEGNFFKQTKSIIYQSNFAVLFSFLSDIDIFLLNYSINLYIHLSTICRDSGVWCKIISE